jgi:hypothetical protein
MNLERPHEAAGPCGGPPSKLFRTERAHGLDRKTGLAVGVFQLAFDVAARRPSGRRERSCSPSWSRKPRPDLLEQPAVAVSLSNNDDPDHKGASTLGGLWDRQEKNQ